METYITLLAGAAFFVIAILMPSKQAALKKNGKKAEGVIFDHNGEWNAMDDFSTIQINDSTRARVRFVTEKLEWITEDVRSGVGFQMNNSYKSGDKVTVYYDPATPTTFFVETGIPESVVRLIIIIAGLMMAGGAAYTLMTSSNLVDN